MGSNQSSIRYPICRPALSRGNLSTEENVLVSRVVFEGKRAVGVEYCDRGAAGAEKKVARGAEIIVCGGAVNSPQLLMLSGVGDETHLKVGWSISLTLLYGIIATAIKISPIVIVIWNGSVTFLIDSS